MQSVRAKVLEQYGEYLIQYNTVSDGFHIVLRFPNGYGASFIHHSGTYGQEIAKMFFTDEYGERFPELSNSEVFEVIEKIKMLEAI